MSDVTEPVIKKGVAWIPVSPDFSGTRVGGNAPAELLDAWPHFEGNPLPFLASIVQDDVIAYVFLGSAEESSWQAENGGNAVLISGSGAVPDWVDLKPVEGSVPLFCEHAFTVVSSMGDEPVWLQGDETPVGYGFFFQIPSQLDGGEEINIGDAYGDAYVFLSEDKKSGKVLWQS